MSEAAVTTEEVVEPTQGEIDLKHACEIVEPLSKKGDSDDDIVVALIQNGGFGFQKAARLLGSALEALGVRMSSNDRYETVAKLILEQDGEFAPTEWSVIDSLVEWLSEEIDSTTEKQALKAVKRFCKEKGIELPKRPRGRQEGGHENSFRTKCLLWMIENPNASDDEFKAFLDAGGGVEGGKKRPRTDYLFYRRIFVTANAMADKKIELAKAA